MSSNTPEVETVVAPTIDSSESESTTAVVTSDVVTQEEDDEWGFRGKNVKLTAPAAKPPQGLQAPGTGQVKITTRTEV